jgi:hypothetical protein
MGGSWTPEEDDLLREYMKQFGRQWTVIASHIPGRNATQVAARWEKCLNPDLMKGVFTPEEDQAIVDFVSQKGIHAWPKVRSVLPHRTPKQCRERWFNNLSPGVSKGPWTPEEDAIIYRLYTEHGAKWALIAQAVSGRTDNAVKNRWNASISKRLHTDEHGEQVLIPGKMRKYTHRKIPGRPPPILTDFEPSIGEPEPLKGPSAFSPTFDNIEIDSYDLESLEFPMITNTSPVTPSGFDFWER